MRNQSESQHLVESTHASTKKFMINRLMHSRKDVTATKQPNSLFMDQLETKDCITKADLTPDVAWQVLVKYLVKQSNSEFSI